MLSPKDVLNKKDELSVLEARLSALAIKMNTSPPKVVPDFARYGWGRLEEFTNRLKQACDEPLVEQAMQLLSDAGVVVDPRVLREATESLGSKMIDVADSVKSSLGAVTEQSLHAAASKEIERLLRNQEWSEAAEAAHSWLQAAGELESAADELQPPPLLRKTLMAALARGGPQEAAGGRCRNIYAICIALGGDKVWRLAGRHPGTDLNALEKTLNELAGARSELDAVLGEVSTVAVASGPNVTLDSVKEGLLKQIKVARSALNKKTVQIAQLETRVSNLAMLAGEGEEPPQDVGTLVDANRRQAYLEERYQQLEVRVKATMSLDAINFLAAVAVGQLPSGWNAQRLEKALQEVLHGYRLVLAIKDA